MNSIEQRLKDKDTTLYTHLQETKMAVEEFLQQYKQNFPTYTDHSLKHTMTVFDLASQVLSDEEQDNLNVDELYILAMGSLLHDIGMCVPKHSLDEFKHDKRWETYQLQKVNPKFETFLRDYHHEISAEFILKNTKELKIYDPNENGLYAEAIALVAKGHRKVELGNPEVYPPRFPVRNMSRSFVCLPYLACVLRIADELDISNMRVSNLMAKYYMPVDPISEKEVEKHLANVIVSIQPTSVKVISKPDNQELYNALLKQFDKIQEVMEYCQKVIHNIGNTDKREFSLGLMQIKPEIKPQGFDPKGIKFDIDMTNVFETFIGKHLYDTPYVAIREAIQNAIDSCRYKIKLEPDYVPVVNVELKGDKLIIQDNGNGMDEFIVKNYFAKLGSSYYSQQSIKGQYEAIGQFGVGVFSYYLLGDCIEVETKKLSSQGLHFTASKSPNDYFYFKDVYNGPTEGTRLTIHLSADIVSALTFAKLKEQIQHYFGFIEFPINLSEGDSKVVINKKSLEVTVKEHVEGRVAYRYKDKIESIKLVQVHIDDEAYEATMAIPYYVEDNDIQCASDLYTAHYENREIVVYQKGVFVYQKFYRRENFEGSIYVINFKAKQPIRLDRNKLDDESLLEEVAQKLSIKLIDKFMTLLSLENSESRKNNFYSFSNFLGGSSFISESYWSRALSVIDRLVMHAFVCFYLNGEKDNKNLTALCEQFDYFILVDKAPDTILVVPQIQIYKKTDFHMFKLIFNNLGYSQEVMFINGKEHVAFNKNGKCSSVLQAPATLFNSNDEKVSYFIAGVIDNTVEYLDYTFYFNINHPFLMFLLENYDSIGTDPEWKLLMEDFGVELPLFYHRVLSLSAIQSIVDRMNRYRGTNFKLTMADFSPSLKVSE